MAEIENANPTILTAAQLPRRETKRRPRRQGPDTRYNDAIFAKPAYFSSPLDENDDGIYAGWLGGVGGDEDDFTEEPIDEQEIYDLIASISDPEHPLTLGQLAVVNLPDIHINPSPLSRMSTTNTDPLVRVLVDITPTINHCSLATVIGLAVRARLEQALPPNYRVQVRVKPGTHTSDDQATKQLADKERVVAALENSGAKRTVEAMLATC